MAFIKCYQRFTPIDAVSQVKQFPSFVTTNMSYSELVHSQSLNLGFTLYDQSAQMCDKLYRTAQEDFSQKHKTISKKTESAKKNSESNIVNQFYAFFSYRNKSEKIIKRVIGSLQKNQTEVQLILKKFHQIFRLVNAARNRKYVNHSTLTACFTVEGLTYSLAKSGFLIRQYSEEDLEQFCIVFRKSCLYFFKNESRPSVLTSKRICSTSTLEHCYKIRKVVKDIADSIN